MKRGRGRGPAAAEQRPPGCARGGLVIRRDLASAYRWRGGDYDRVRGRVLFQTLPYGEQRPPVVTTTGENEGHGALVSCCSSSSCFVGRGCVGQVPCNHIARSGADRTTPLPFSERRGFDCSIGYCTPVESSPASGDIIVAVSLRAKIRFRADSALILVRVLWFFNQID